PIVHVITQAYLCRISKVRICSKTSV
ncbi:hypothetical protein VCHENC02_1246B, partial [Vibrio harveyi]